MQGSLLFLQPSRHLLILVVNNYYYHYSLAKLHRVRVSPTWIEDSGYHCVACHHTYTDHLAASAAYLVRSV